MPYNGNSTNTNCWMLSDCIAAVRREILDPTGQWWTDTEITQYVNDWQSTLENQFEFMWGSATVSSSLSTLTLSSIDPNMLRLDAIYCTPGTGTWGTDTCTYRLSGRDIIDVDWLQQDWRTVTTNTGLFPTISYQNDIYTVSFYPPPPGVMTFVFEYPVLTTLTASTDFISVPCWTRYSVIQYATYRCYARFGPNQDLPKAGRRKMRWEKCIRKFRKVYDAYVPQRSEMLRPGRRYAGQIVNPRQNGQILPSGGI